MLHDAWEFIHAYLYDHDTFFDWGYHMRKKTIGIFFILSIVIGVIGAGLIVAGLIGSTFATTTTEFSRSSHVTHFGNLPLFIVGVAIASLSGIPYLIAWIGALVNVARLQQWVWFIVLFFFHWIALLIYLIAGPTAVAGIAQYAPRSDALPQPRQDYPQP